MRATLLRGCSLPEKDDDDAALEELGGVRAREETGKTANRQPKHGRPMALALVDIDEQNTRFDGRRPNVVVFDADALVTLFSGAERMVSPSG